MSQLIRWSALQKVYFGREIVLKIKKDGSIRNQVLKKCDILFLDSKSGIKERRGFYGMRGNVELERNHPKKFKFSVNQELIVQILRQ